MSPSSSFVNNRLIPNAMEPRAANAHYTRHDDSYTLYVANQNPHVERLLMCAFVLGLPENKVRVIAPDVGGGFGSQDLPVRGRDGADLGQQARRPADQVDGRAQRILPDRRARPRPRHHGRAGDGRGGQLPGAARRTPSPTWAPTCRPSRPACRPSCTPRCWPGQYKTPAIYAEVKAVFTNTAPVDAYRGAGRPEATYVVERIVETAAREMKMDPVADPPRRTSSPSSRTPRRSA